LFIVLMTMLFWHSGRGLHGVVQTFVVHFRAWACYAIPVVLELGWRFAHPGLYITGGSATTGQTLGFVGLTWTQTLVPLTFGVDPWVLPTHVERVFAGVLGQVLFVGFVVGTILRRRAAWRAWVLLGATFLVRATLVGVTRAGTYGPGDASDVKYVALDVFFLVIAVGFALLPVRGSTVDSPTATVPSTSPRSRPLFPVLVVLTVVAVILVYGVALVFDQNRDSESAASHASHRFFANFATSWAATASTTPHAFLWNTEINPRIVTRSFYPYDTASVTVGRLHPGIRFDQSSGTGFLLRSDGSVVPSRAVTQAQGVMGGGTACTDPHGGGRITVTLDHGLNGAKQWFGLVSYRSTTGAVATRSDGTTLVFPKGDGTLITPFPPAPLGSVVWSVQPPANVCITGFRVVRPEPVGAHPHRVPSA
jgi:hypothetical protein